MTGAPATFSLLLPVYHGDDAAHLRRAFRSATLDQVLPPDEVVLVQDGPVGPALGAVVDEIESGPVPTTVVRLPRNVGLALALQAGLAACSHEIVARTDADDVCLPDRFARQVPLVAGGYDIVGSAIQEFVSEDEPGIVRVPPLTTEQITEGARFHSPFNHPTVVFRRSAVSRAGGYQDLPLLEDYWLFTRMLAGGARGLNLREPLLLYRVGAGAYARRGGVRLLRSEIELQRRMRRIGFTTTAQWARNVVVRGGYRLVPEKIRVLLYRGLLTDRAR
ncbi:glycosyltransferase [Cellulosimicrobium protaetiae]|uniref:Glycosyltransferase n=1 Tax=Cellulosimicrobium protaetiae TaxID=2587808 RepID=A0A6M5UC59_9MICO|nr:glycosyltransferase [Cellulosimicrobium protaetiae]QJW36097.1 glycosyltransferase [Cellulosimicrobium protaetiae]